MSERLPYALLLRSGKLHKFQSGSLLHPRCGAKTVETLAISREEAARYAEGRPAVLCRYRWCFRAEVAAAGHDVEVGHIKRSTRPPSLAVILSVLNGRRVPGMREFEEAASQTRRVPLDLTQPCVLWTGTVDRDGYPRDNSRSPHRLVYQAEVGDLVLGLDVDHACHERRCVNPAHLRLLDHATNVRQSRRALSSTCQRGHPFDAANTYYRATGTRRCRACANQRDRAERQSARRAVA